MASLKLLNDLLVDSFERSQFEAEYQERHQVSPATITNQHFQTQFVGNSLIGKVAAFDRVITLFTIAFVTYLVLIVCIQYYYNYNHYKRLSDQSIIASQDEQIELRGFNRIS